MSNLLNYSQIPNSLHIYGQVSPCKLQPNTQLSTHIRPSITIQITAKYPTLYTHTVKYHHTNYSQIPNSLHTYGQVSPYKLQPNTQLSTHIRSSITIQITAKYPTLYTHTVKYHHTHYSQIPNSLHIRSSITIHITAKYLTLYTYTVKYHHTNYSQIPNPLHTYGQVSPYKLQPNTQLSTHIRSSITIHITAKYPTLYTHTVKYHHTNYSQIPNSLHTYGQVSPYTLQPNT